MSDSEKKTWVMAHSDSGIKFYKEYKLIQTSIACPQQFSVIKENKEVAYFRLRHGKFSASIVEDDGRFTKIYETMVLGDGVFEEEEEEIELKNAVEKIDEYLNSMRTK